MAEIDLQDQSSWGIPEEGEFCVYGTVRADPEHADEVAAIYRATTRKAEAEEGTLYYCISRDVGDASLFHFFERYSSKEAFARHNDQDVIRELMSRTKGVTASFAKAITP